MNESLKELHWDKFPVEEKEFICSICLEENYTERKECRGLIKYLESIFPEQVTTVYENREIIKALSENTIYKQNHKKLPRKSTRINFTQGDERNWAKNLSLINFLKNGYLLAVGEYKYFPKNLLSVSDLIILENEKLANEYFQRRRPRYSISLNKDVFLVLDKRNFNFEISYLQKKEMKECDYVPS